MRAHLEIREVTHFFGVAEGVCFFNCFGLQIAVMRTVDLPLAQQTLLGDLQGDIEFDVRLCASWVMLVIFSPIIAYYLSCYKCKLETCVNH